MSFYLVISNKIVEVFPSLTDNLKVTETALGKEFIKKEFEDLTMKPEERERRLFG